MKFFIGKVNIEVNLNKMLNGVGIEIEVTIPVNQKFVEIKLDWNRIREQIEVNVKVEDGIPF